MRERPILFSAEMVRAILDDRKTQTRRLMVPQPEHLQEHTWRGKQVYEGEHRVWCWKEHTFENLIDEYIREPERLELSCMSPYGIVGDRLWVKEAIACLSIEPCPIIGDRATVVFQADGAPCVADSWPWQRMKLPGMFMPYGLRRITLEITEVRVQRLQEISEGDARAEGVTPYTPPDGHISPEQRVPGPGFERCRLGDQPHRLPFADLWDRINGRDGRRWSDNPFVWAISFRRVEAR